MKRLGGGVKGCVSSEMQPTATPPCSCSMMADGLDASGLPRMLPPPPPADSGSSSPCACRRRRTSIALSAPHMPSLGLLVALPASLMCHACLHCADESGAWTGQDGIAYVMWVHALRCEHLLSPPHPHRAPPQGEPRLGTMHRVEKVPGTDLPASSRGCVAGRGLLTCDLLSMHHHGA